MNDAASPVLTAIAAAVLFGSLTTWAWIALRMARGRALVPVQAHAPVPWGFAEVLITFGIFAGGALVFGALMRGALHVPMAADAAHPKAMFISLVAGAGAQFLALVASVVLIRRSTGATAADLGWQKDFAARDALLGIGAFFAAAIPVLGLSKALEKLIPYHHPIIEIVRDQHDLPFLIAISIVAVVVAPLAEEYFFRVLLQGWLEAREDAASPDRRWFAGWTPGLGPILLSSLVFALLHVGQGAAHLPLFFFAMALGYLYNRTHRMTPSLVAHMCLNGLTMLQLWLAPQSAWS